MKVREFFFWCCVFTCAVFMTARPAHASGSFTLPPVVNRLTDQQVSTVHASTGAGACQAFATAFGVIYDSATNATDYPPVSGICNYHNSSTDTASHTTAVNLFQLTPACPTNYTMGTYGGYSYYCLVNSSGNTTANGTCTGTTCTCNTGYQPDAAKTACVAASACTVDPLPPLPADDACAEVLENIGSTQAQKDAACGALTPALQAGEACLMDKLSRTNDLVSGTPIPLKITADIRDIAYQAHLRQVWDKMETLVSLMKKDPAMQTACAARRAEIAAEKGCDNAGVCKSCYAESATQRSHCLKGMPASPNPNDAQHTQGNAFDVSATSTIAPLQDALDARNPPQTIPQFLDDPTNCNLVWGGTFKTNKDPVHFQVR